MFSPAARSALAGSWTIFACPSRQTVVPPLSAIGVAGIEPVTCSNQLFYH